MSLTFCVECNNLVRHDMTLGASFLLLTFENNAALSSVNIKATTNVVHGNIYIYIYNFILIYSLNAYFCSKEEIVLSHDHVSFIRRN